MKCPTCESCEYTQYCGATEIMRKCERHNKKVEMTKEVKIKCDDCKFVEDCVDYGWQDCKKFTPKPSEPMTNEEWFCGLSTEEKAEVIAEKIRHAQLQYVPTYGTFTNSDWWVEWLKQPHEEE